MSEAKVPKFEDVQNEIEQRLDGMGFSRDAYGDAYFNVKLNTIFHLMVEKNIVTIDELIGKRLTDGSYVGGKFEEVAKGMKALERR